MLIEATTQTVEDHVYILYGDDDLHIGTGVTIQSTLTDAIATWSGAHKFTVDGTIISEDDGINTMGCDPAISVIIHAGAQINSGADGVVANADGVILDGVGSVMTNAGIVHASGSAASVFVRDIGTTTVSNSGTMYGDVAGVWHKFGTGILYVNNTGTIESPTNAILGGVSSDIVTNSGTIRGTIDLSGGDDVLDNRGGTVIGNILGGEGDDRFVLSTKAEVIDGGLGFDKLDFSTYTTGVTVDLAVASYNRGTPVLNDSYTGFEGVLGTSANDILRGDAGDNLLVGNAGADSLIGGAGADTLVGGAGTDTMLGGTDADVFQFLVTTGLSDKINDFTSGADQIQLEGSAFSYGNAVGAVSAADFVTSTSARAAHDASDHFIFRTTDATLWFDPDGNGYKGQIMIADLQTGASLTAADLWLI